MFLVDLEPDWSDSASEAEDMEDGEIRSESVLLPKCQVRRPLIATHPPQPAFHRPTSSPRILFCPLHPDCGYTYTYLCSGGERRRSNEGVWCHAEAPGACVHPAPPPALAPHHQCFVFWRRRTWIQQANARYARKQKSQRIKESSRGRVGWRARDGRT